MKLSFVGTIILSLSSLSAFALTAAEEPCAATPESAARAMLTGSVSDAVKSGGFRVQDLQADQVQRRVWVRVRRCDQPTAPLILLPLHAPLHAPEVVAQISASAPQAVQVTEAPKPKPVLIRAGQAVTAIFASGTTRMELQATSNQQGSEGDRIELTLKHRAGQAQDEPEHRMHGTVRADSTVEVQP